MNCPKCGAGYDKIRVTDSRESPEDMIRRRRNCMKCGYRFTTYEITERQKAVLEISKRKYESLRASVNELAIKFSGGNINE